MTPLGLMERDGNTAEFLDGTARGEFLLRRCRQCQSIGGPQEGQCPACGSPETDWIPASGGAKILSWSVVYGRNHDGQSGPQAVVIIAEFDEGPWWWSQLIDADPDQVATGDRLVAAFEQAEGGEYLPVFRLA